MRRAARNALLLGGYRSDAKALFARMTNQMSPARKRAVSNFIGAIPNVWEKCDALGVPFFVEDQQQALLSWKNGLYGLTPVTTVSFTRLVGLSGRVGSGFNPFTAAGHFSKDSASIAYFTDNSEASAGLDAGNTNTLLQTRSATDVLSSRVNAGASASINTYTDGSGRYVLSRTGAALTRRYKNGTQLGADSTSVSADPASSEIQFNGRNGSVTDGTRSMKLWLIAEGLTAADVAELDAAYLGLLAAG